jgi:hypothetical protein
VLLPLMYEHVKEVALKNSALEVVREFLLVGRTGD